MPLASHFLRIFTDRFGCSFQGFSTDAQALMLAYEWPGNIRELKNAVERAVVVERADEIQAESLPIFPRSAERGRAAAPADGEAIAVADLPLGWHEARTVFEKAYFEEALRRRKGNLAAIARDAGVPRTTVYRRLKALGLSRDG